ncbi:hypothetical protein GGE06_007969 [Streptomyces sp. SFB5A]|uniref:Uncharacterized protein n=1 Tax=Streptomyces nymphaeiformis TaxID=2663842 RepID=A0A7W7UA28_9ACTN|nr:hypothetical protein [Streptomyces nymphaeiformis]
MKRDPAHAEQAVRDRPLRLVALRAATLGAVTPTLPR